MEAQPQPFNLSNLITPMMMSFLAVITIILAALFFGSQFVPQKFCKEFDSKAYNLSMIMGIALISTVMTALSLLFKIPGNSPQKKLVFADMALSTLAGIIWSLGNFFILAAISKIGISRTFPVVNLLVVVAFFSGIIFLGELRSINYAVLLMLSLGIAGVLIGSFLTAKATSREEKKIKDVKGGVMAAALSALFFGVYNVPILVSLNSDTWSPYLAMFFLGIGALLGAVIFGFLWLRRGFFVLWHDARQRWHLLAISGGMIWGMGQVTAIIAFTYTGVAIGTPVLQGIVIVVGAVWGLAVFRELKDVPPEQRRKALHILFFGCAFALMGALVIGYAAGYIY